MLHYIPAILQNTKMSRANSQGGGQGAGSVWKPLKNLPTAFWGLLGPQKRCYGEFYKNHKQGDGNHPDIIGMVKDHL